MQSILQETFIWFRETNDISVNEESIHLFTLFKIISAMSRLGRIGKWPYTV